MKNLNPSFIILVFIVPVLLISFNACKKSYVLSYGPWNEDRMSADSISFIIMGDWGKHGAKVQKAVADQMHIFSKKFNARFIITTGDNFYEQGVASVNDPHWTASFENVYYKEGHQIPWYPVLGNHDYQSIPQAQIDYSKKSSRWNMPGRYHSFEKKINDSSSALFVFADTSPFVEEYYSRNNMSDLKQQDTAAQFRWLEQTLSNSSVKWKIVIGHHPVYSVGRHGNTSELIKRYRPLLNKADADIYLAGHDHSLQHISIPTDSVQYLVSGAASEATSVSPDPFTLFARAIPGFTIMTLYPSRANFYFFSQRGELQHRWQMLK